MTLIHIVQFKFKPSADENAIRGVRSSLGALIDSRMGLTENIAGL